MPSVPIVQREQQRALGMARDTTSLREMQIPDTVTPVARARDRLIGAVDDFMQKQQEQADETAVWNAYNEFSNQERDYLYNPEKGAMNRKSGDALGITQQSTSDLGQMAQQIGGSLQNDRQRNLFNRLYQRNMRSTAESLGRYEMQQRGAFQDQVAAGVVRSAEQNIGLRWNDPKYINEEIDLAALSMRSNLSQKGTPSELIGAEVQALRSKMWKSAIGHAIQQSPLEAKRLFDENRDQFTQQDILAIEKTLEQPVRVAQGSAIAGKVLSPSGTIPMPVATKIATEAAAQGVNITTATMIAKLENPTGDPNRKNPESTAMGVYQFIDSAWADEGGTADDRTDIDQQIKLGIQRIKKNTDGLRESLGREPSGAEVYLAHQQGLAGAKALLNAPADVSAVDAISRFYGSDNAKATAAITKNGGSENMTAGQFVQMWERKFNKRTGQDGVAQIPLSDLVASARALAGDDEELQNTAVSEVIAQYRQAKAVAAADEASAMENIYGHILKTGTIQGASSEDLSKLSNSQLLKLQKSSERTTTNWAFYDDFMSKSPAERASVPVDVLAENLTGAQVQAALKERHEGASGKADKWSQTQGSIIKSYAMEAGLPVQTGSKTLKAKEAAQYNAYSQYMNERMSAYKDEHGRPMPEREFRQEAARAVSQVVVNGSFWDSTSRVFELSGRDFKSVRDITPSMRSDIEGRLREDGYVIDDAIVLSVAAARIRGDNKALQEILLRAKKVKK